MGAVIEAIRNTMDRHTSEIPDDWSLANPARGNCHVSSLVLFHYFPTPGTSFILQGTTTGGELHFWNVINGVTIDVTRDQFPLGVRLRDITDATDQTLNKTTQAKFHLLLGRVQGYLRNRP